ncbi:tectonin beta-propeller repeat-containing protein 2-like isoform X2 [Saccostrea echinata]|uniref:tectonin beta-propeller repeat-containing protein 2-like isoform X2 n=1 Tax=Saccostrea echinata TaxID=191078 RepID=UPI002A81848A|nr:tectonin beta-propeller repeat-containing protein 2-like isoform X2 [Saccostrea echinata]
MAESAQTEDSATEECSKHSIPKEHRSLDYLLSQIPRRAQKGFLSNCDLILKCVDVNPDYIALGTNVGVVYLFDRKKELIERLKTHSNSDVLTTIALHSGLENQVAVGTEKGDIYIFQLPSHIPGQNKKLQQFFVQGLHKAQVTCTRWSLNGMKLFSGDMQGLVVCTEFDAYQGQCKSAVLLTEVGSSIVQLDHGHKSLLVSTKQRTLIYRTDETKVQVGQKERKVAGPFGACFIPAMCKPEDAQLYACRPGARIWKADMNGTVSNTYLFKELLNSTHSEIQLLYKNGIPSSRVSDHQFGPLLLYMEKYLVTWNETSLYVLSPEDNSVVGSQRALGAVVDVAVSEDEIFILRKNNERNLVRVAVYPEKKGDTLIPRGPSGVKVHVTQDGSAKNDSVYSSATVTEEKLSSAVGDDDIVFNSKPKRHKKKKKGLKGERDSTHSPYLSAVLDQENTEDNISLRSSDTISIKSDISEGPYFTEELQEKPKFMTVVDAEGHVKKVRSRESSPAPSTKRSHSEEKSHLVLPLHGLRNSSCDSLSKSLEEFEKEITSLDNKTGTHEQDVELRKEETSTELKEIPKCTEQALAPKKEKQFSDLKDIQKPDASVKPNETVLNTALSQIATSVTEAEKILLSDKDPSVEKLNKASHVSNSSSENSLLNSPAQKDPSLFSSPEPDDFYKMFTSNTNMTSQKDVTEHPLMPSTTEEQEENEIVCSEKVEMDEPSYKVINNWSEIFTPGNLSCLCLTDTHIWHVDRSSNLWHCSLTNPGLKWQKANGYAKMIAVSRSGSIVWRLYKDTVYAGTKLTAKHPEGLKWIEAVREVQYISVDETVAWYLKTNGDVVMQKGLSRERPCFKAIKIPCDFKLTQIACYKGVVLGLTDQCQLVYRDGINKECLEGKEWNIIKCKCSQEMLFSAIAFGVGGVLWALDVLGRIWFSTGVTMETPTGDGSWWEVPVSEIVVKDVSGIDALRSLAEKFDPQKLASLISSQTGGLITAGRAGVWLCPEFKNMIQICRGVIQGHAWEVAEIPGIVCSVIWKTVTAQASNEGLIWASQPNGDIYTFSSNLEKCSMVESPSYRKGVLCLCVCRDAVWVLTEDNQIFIRSGIRPSNPQGSGWCKLDLTQLGDTVLTSISCGTVNVWAVDTQGVVYQRIGVKAPTSHSLNAAWLPVDMGRQTSTVFTNIATGPKDFMVWAIDNRRQVYARKGVTEDMPIGEDWIHVPGTLATHLTVSKKCVWALNPNGEILCRFGISTKNPTGDYWRKVPGVFDQISVSHSDQMWAVSQEGQLHRRFTKFLNKNSASDPDKLLPKRSSTSISSDDGWELL